ncbi:ataxin-7-like protein 2b [Parambassis ranga]|uniref:Ataxin-7-like protein 2b n=1 Tax=Parambassis ranga TaxID=210632 RepID=A0A6P7ICP3_9TELE|nr:ataxin-7-like protein 2 [Parambassis ranga]
MAALDRRNPNLEDFVGLNWSCWVDRVNKLSSDAGSNAEDEGRCGMKRPETMTLRKEDMHIYGYCPAHDDFYLVMCNHCGQVVKPQAFEKHCERRHGAVINMSDQSSAPAPQQRSCPSQPVSSISSCTERQKDDRRREGGGAVSTAALPAHQHRAAMAHKETVSLSSVKNPDKNPPLPLHSSTTPSPRNPPSHSGPLAPGDCSSSASGSERAPVQKASAGQSEAHCPLRGMRTYSRIYKNTNKKECKLNKHNKVLPPERKKPCSQELICNNDSIHQQQNASGKLKIIDQLAVEQKMASAARDKEQLLVKSKHKEKHLDTLEEKMTTQGNLSSNCHILRSTNPPENSPEEERNGTVEVKVHPPYPFNQSLLSSDDGEEDEQDEAANLPATSWHPKPLGLCTFGCRTFGWSVFTFDRRSYHLRFALGAMLERHVGTHLWKKMPQVSSGLRSRHVKPQIETTVRTLDKPSKSTGFHSLESTSLGQLAMKRSQQTFHTTKLPYSTDSACLGADRQCKAQLKLDLMQNASAAQKVRYTKMLHSSEDKSSGYIREPPHIPSSQGPATSTLSHRKKPCPPLPKKPAERQLSGLEKCFPASTYCSPRSRGKPQEAKQKVMGSDQRNLAQKRKGNEQRSLALSSSLSRASKYKCLSSTSRSSLVSWKGESIEDVLS